MPKRTKHSPNGKSVAAILLLTGFGAGVFAAYVRLTPAAAHVDAPRPAADDSTSFTHEPNKTPEQEPAAAKTSDQLLVPAISENDIKLDKPAGDPPSGVTPQVFLLNQTLSSLQINGARALGVEMKGHLALVDFNPGIEKGYGTIEEGYLIKSLQMALGQFKDIDKFQIYVDGKAVDSFGNIDLSAPLNVIRPGETQPSGDESKAPPPN